MKNYIKGGLVAAGIVGLSFFVANTEANVELFNRLKIEGLGSEVKPLKVDTQGIIYTRNGGLYSLHLEEGTPYKVQLLEDTTIHESYVVSDGIIYTDSEGVYHSYSFESNITKTYLDSESLGVINEGEVIPLSDTDNDGVYDYMDNCINKRNTSQSDRDGDGLGNACDEDIDGDGYSNELELEHGTSKYKPQEIPSEVPPDIGVPTTNNDIDGDGVLDVDDNCPTVSNSTQWDNNENGIGNLCDPDIDGDGYSNTEELAAKSSPWEETSTPDNINGYVPPKDCNET